MGLLTDPSAGQGRFTKALTKHYSKICILAVIGGIIWFGALASPSMNAGTYFSENALLPGLVKHQFHDGKLAERYYEELVDEMKKFQDTIPYTWLLAKFRQNGLDSYTHNFSVNSPISKEKYSGKNVYAILRAARASSTEALVLSTPYRHSLSVHPPTAPSIALMLAFAKYANNEKYWAKDIIFLITEHEQLGIQAWLEAYHGTTCGNPNTLLSGDLKGRAGAIQAAINLELHDIKIAQMDIKIEGLNGQLPNLDLFNLASKMCTKEGVLNSFKGTTSQYFRDPIKEWQHYFKTLMLMFFTQASGIPNGNHGLFHRFGIQALTLEGFPSSTLRGSSKIGFLSMGRILEGTFRSLNNLLERFHQSFFFYLLPSSDRYISIGLYMPAICAIAGALIIKACAMWCKLQEKDDEKSKATKISFEPILVLILLVHLSGVLMMSSPQYITQLAEMYGIDTKVAVFYSLVAFSLLLALSLPVVIPFKSKERDMTVLNVISLLELGTALICISMNNFSFGMFCATISVPFALFAHPTSCKYYSYLQRFFWLFLHPLVVVFFVVLVNTVLMFSDEHWKEILRRNVEATQHAVIYSIVDSMIYGNWMFSVVTCIFLPNWMCFWCTTFARLPKKTSVVDSKKKTN